jgi:hypothetical protein
LPQQPQADKITSFHRSSREHLQSVSACWLGHNANNFHPFATAGEMFTSWTDDLHDAVMSTRCRCGRAWLLQQ